MAAISRRDSLCQFERASERGELAHEKKHGKEMEKKKGTSQTHSGKMRARLTITIKRALHKYAWNMGVHLFCPSTRNVLRVGLDGGYQCAFQRVSIYVRVLRYMPMYPVRGRYGFHERTMCAPEGGRSDAFDTIYKRREERRGTGMLQAAGRLIGDEGEGGRETGRKPMARGRSQSSILLTESPARALSLSLGSASDYTW